MYICVCVCVYVCVCVCVCMCVCVRVCTYTYTEREIGGIASPNATHFRGNCESLCQSDWPNFFWHCKSLLADYVFQVVSPNDFIFGPHPFLDEISPFSDTFYIGLYDAKERIRCE